MLNGYTDISAETSDKVYAAIRTLDFVPSNTARMLSKKETRIIGLTIPDIKDPFFSENAAGAEKLLQENGYEIFYGNMERSSEKLLNFLQQARQMRFDGVIITPDEWSDALLDAIRKLTIPLVALRRRPPQSSGVPYVDNDHYRGAMEMMTYLTGLGHTKIAHIVLPTEIGEIRRSGYRDFCRIRGIEARDVRIGLPANKLDQAKENGYQAMRMISERYPDSTAVFAGTDQLAIGAMVFLREKGLAVPEKISVAGVNDMDYASLPWFNLTTMSLNRTEMGRAAARMLLDIIEKRQTHPENLLMGTSLIVRGSTRKI
uniref:LacI family transcriptional regulator n=1 Tax=uncultured bacterium Contigcl_23 TaxID=1393667 RepID=W0FKZ3_9BACT|nr:LacI family transcriptional regulator [uncultured bacterium Contigcl_23]